MKRATRRKLLHNPELSWEKWDKLMAMAAPGSGATDAERSTAKNLADKLKAKLEAAGIPKPAPKKSSGWGGGSWGAWTPGGGAKSSSSSSSKSASSGYTKTKSKSYSKPPPKAKDAGTIKWTKGVNGGWLGQDADGVFRWTIDYDASGPTFTLRYRPAGAWGQWQHVATYDTIFAAKAKAEKVKAEGPKESYSAPPPKYTFTPSADLLAAAKYVANAASPLIPSGAKLSAVKVYGAGTGVKVQWTGGTASTTEAKVMFNRGGRRHVR